MNPFWLGLTLGLLLGGTISAIIFTISTAILANDLDNW
jgi:hypothetical protein